VLVVVDDAQLGATLRDRVHALGFKALSAANAHTALALANEYMPNAAIVGVKPRAADAWASVMLLHQDPDTRHIPVSVVCIDDKERTFVCMGALGSTRAHSRIQAVREALRGLGQFQEGKPRRLLVADASKAQRKEIASALAADHLHVIAAATGKQALKVLGARGFDCTIIGQSLADMGPLDFVRHVVESGSGEQLGIVMHRPADAGAGADQGEPNEFAEMLVLRRAQSAAAVLEHAALCLNEAMKDAPAVRARPLPASRFALTSALEQHGMRVHGASGGFEGIETLKKNPDIDIVLMDMMMPDQDGYQTVRLMRGMELFRDLPIIGVTAGAMKGDREKCIAAGASDYLSKPVDLEQLLSVMRMWLADKPAAAQPGSDQICTTPA
jgi:CheY-like chemotaxis protein